MNRSFLLVLFLTLWVQLSCTKEEYSIGESVVVTGIVTDRETGNPIPNVVISDGYSTTLTTENGVYFLKSHPDARHIFYSIPEEYEVPLKGGAPCFYSEIDSQHDTCVVNFNLTPLKNGIENEFTLFCVADPLLSTNNNEKRFKSETIEDIKKETKKYPISYGITLGDLVSNTPEFFPIIKKEFLNTEISFFHTIGNHDHLKSENNPLKAVADFEYHFGPVNYSFNRGKAHIVVMNSVLYKGSDIYKGGFTNDQISWLQSDLSHVPKNKLLIICVHIPILSSNNISNEKKFIDIVKQFNEVHIMSGHFHRNKNILYENANIYEHITASASGLWWSGTVNYCGAPNGYAVYQIKDNTIKNWYYKSTRFDSDYQIRMYTPYTLGDTEGYVVAHVWNADPSWKIELYENGINKGQMEQFTDYDPGTYEFLKSRGTTEFSNLLSKTDHLFRLKPSNPSASFSIKSMDKFGNIYYQNEPFDNVKILKSY